MGGEERLDPDLGGSHCLQGRAEEWDFILGVMQKSQSTLSRGVTRSHFRGASANSLRLPCKEWLEMGGKTRWQGRGLGT